MSLTTPYFEQFLLADGRTTVFSFGKGFDALSPTFVKCQVFNTDGSVIVPKFTVDMQTGSITIVSLTTPDGKTLNAPLAGSIVRVYRDVPETQELTVASLKTSTAQQIVNMFNNVVAMIQELQYSDEHFTVRSTLPQRDLTFQLLDEDSHKKLVYWDNDKRQLVVTEYPEDEVVLSDNVYRLKVIDGSLYYLDSEGWKLSGPKMEYILEEMKKSFYTKLEIDAKVNTLATKKEAHELSNQTADLYKKTTALKERVDRHDERLDKLDSSVDILYDTKIDKRQGKTNVGKVLTVGPDGLVKPKVATGAGGGIIAVAHDNTLIGAGTDEYPLGVKDKTTITIVDWE